MMHEQGKLKALSKSFLRDGVQEHEQTEVVAEGKIEIALPDSEEKATLSTIQ